MKPKTPFVDRPKIKKIRLRVDPDQGIAKMATSMVVEGYRFVKAERRNTQAVITFERVDS